MLHRYPLFLDVRDRLIVIVGGGAVAARKATGLLVAGANRVRCIAPAFHAELDPRVERITEEYASRHLEGAVLVFAVTDQHAINDCVVKDCRARGILVNRADADETEPGDFITPAKWEDGEVTVAVAAGSPALSAALRDHLAQTIDPRYTKMAEAMVLLRPAIRASQKLSVERAQVFRELATEDALAVLDRGGIDALRKWIVSRFPELSHV